MVPNVRGVSRTMVVRVGGRRRNMMWRNTPYIQGSIVDAVLHSSVAERIAHCDQVANADAETCSFIRGF